MCCNVIDTLPSSVCQGPCDPRLVSAVAVLFPTSLFTIWGLQSCAMPIVSAGAALSALEMLSQKA